MSLAGFIELSGSEPASKLSKAYAATHQMQPRLGAQGSYYQQWPLATSLHSNREEKKL